ncbi:TetR/AcrR family transcriptional regulator [Amycolatopsis pigmentata]|uniref:TetR/AcrR family transcriptional regulator n=1 Tax=Amycolatopsis pigmentata TaxID=450801 RepID=A0ABW5G331_9PSEU
MRQDVSQSRSDPDPRFVRSQVAIREAAAALLSREGPGAVTHQRVAAEAQVARATVYRHWPRVEQLLLDAVLATELPFFRDPTSPVRDWLRTSLRALADDLTEPAVRATTLTLMQRSQWDEDLAGHRDGFLAELEQRLDAAFTLAADAGEISGPRDPRAAAAALIGPLIYLAVLRTAPVPESLIDDLVDQALR